MANVSEQNPLIVNQPTGFINSQNTIETISSTANIVAPVEYASFLSRVGASILDGLITGSMGILIGFLLGVVSGLFSVLSVSGSATGVSMTLKQTSRLLSSAVPIVYYIYLTGLTGQTLGKKLMKIKVVDINNNNVVGYKRAFIREFVGKTISLLVLSLGYWSILWDKNKQGWHDKMTHSVVIKVN